MRSYEFSSFKSSSSEETITIVEEFEESDSDYILCKGSIGPKKKIHKVNSGKDLDNIDVKVKFLCGLSPDNEKRVNKFGVKKPLTEIFEYLVKSSTNLNIINLPELLERILYFLVKYIELKGNDLKYGHYFPDDYTYHERD
ncbi:1609_t:CDS:2, partial [Racocetra persica]